MIFKIDRFIDYGPVVCVSFDGDVPVEVREAIIAAGFMWHDYAGYWIGPDRENEDVLSLINGALKTVKPRPVMTKADEADLKAEYMNRLSEKNDRMRRYNEKEIGALVRLTDGRIVCVKKPRIKTEFCFGESGYDADDAARMADIARTRESFFLRENLEELECIISVLARTKKEDNGYDDRVVWVTNAPWLGEGIATHYIDKNRDAEEVSEEDRERLLEGYRKVHADFSKRLNTYLKKYGLSKVISWTYWRDA